MKSKSGEKSVRDLPRGHLIVIKSRNCYTKYASGNVYDMKLFAPGHIVPRTGAFG